jgi:hypothetical protein
VNERRNFLKMASVAAIPAAATVLSSGVAQADDGSVADFLGAWNTIHTLSFPPGHFREYLSFGDGKVLHETNSFLHTHSNLNFSGFGLPSIVNGSDGIGSWERIAKGKIRITFRKLLFDGARSNFGDLLVTGELQSDGKRLHGFGDVSVVDPFDKVLVRFGRETTEGTRIR